MEPTSQVAPVAHSVRRRSNIALGVLAASALIGCGSPDVAGTAVGGTGSATATATSGSGVAARAACPPQQDTAPTPAAPVQTRVGCFRLVDSYDDAVGDDDEDRALEDFVITFGVTRAWADGACGPIEYRYTSADPFFGGYDAITLAPTAPQQCSVGGDGGDFPRGTLAVVPDDAGGMTLTTGHLSWVFTID